MVAPAGAGPCPHITSVRPRPVSCTMIGTSPPGPFRCGSTTCSVNAVAAPASNALPPFSSVAIPTAVAIQCVEVTTPNVPSISGRVVNGSGLILPMGIQLVVQAAHLTTAGAACQPGPLTLCRNKLRRHPEALAAQRRASKDGRDYRCLNLPPRRDNWLIAAQSLRINASFLALLQPLIWRSAEIPSLIRSKCSDHTSTTGRR